MSTPGGSPFSISSKAGIERLLRAVSLPEWSHYLPLISAVHAGHIALVLLAREGRLLETAGGLAADMPTLVLIGDDDDAPTGPSGWADAEQAMRWARATVLHATGAQPEHFRMAVEMTLHHQRVTMVETSSAQLPAWFALARPSLARPTLIIKPPPGETHPSAPARRSMQ